MNMPPGTEMNTCLIILKNTNVLSGSQMNTLLIVIKIQMCPPVLK